MARYRIEVAQGLNPKYYPQIWRWWFPFWCALETQVGDGGSWWPVSFDSEEEARQKIERHRTPVSDQEGIRYIQVR